MTTPDSTWLVKRGPHASAWAHFWIKPIEGKGVPMSRAFHSEPGPSGYLEVIKIKLPNPSNPSSYDDWQPIPASQVPREVRDYPVDPTIAIKK